MIYVIKIKDTENIFYTRRFDKVISLLEQNWGGDDDLGQKIIIERVQKTHEDWINLEVMPVQFVRQMIRGKTEVITEEVRNEAMGNFLMDEDEDVADFDNNLEMFRDIDKFTAEKAAEAKVEFEEKESAADLMKDMLKESMDVKEDGFVEVVQPEDLDKVLDNIPLEAMKPIPKPAMRPRPGAKKPSGKGPKPIRRVGE